MTKEKLKTILGIGGLVLAPWVSYLLFEYVTGNLQQIPWMLALLNVGWIYVVYLIVFAIAGTSRAAVPIPALCFYLLSLAETFVVSFRDRPIMLWDVMAFQTAMSVSGNYKFQITFPMAAAGVCVLVLIVFAILFPFRIKGIKKRLAAAGGCGAAAAAFGAWFFLWVIPVQGLAINMWEVSQTFREYGYVLSTAVSCQYIIKEKPEGYSLSKESYYNKRCSC